MAPRFVAHAALLGALALLGGFALGSSERAPPRVSAASVRSPSAGAEAEMDDGLYSRQLLTIGRDAQLRVSQSRVLVTGLRGTGVEVAKNLILAGVRAVTLHDDAPVGWADLAANYCLEEAHVGKPRAACVRHALASLNPEHVEVDVHHGALTAAQLAAANVTVLVAADLDHAEEVRLNALCRLAGVRFVGACGRGVFGRIFCDFGRGDDDEFVVEDTDGEPAREVHIQELRVDGTVELAEASGPHGLARGDFVTFSNVEGLEDICADGLSFRVERVCGRKGFNIAPAALAAAAEGCSYVRGGMAKRVKPKATLRFSPLELASEQRPLPLLPMEGCALTPRRDASVHAFFCAMGDKARKAGASAFVAKTRSGADSATVAGSQTAAASETDATAAASAMGCEVEVETAEVAEHAAFASSFFRQERAALRPMAALLGGIGAQEALKACTHRWSPIRQFFYFDAADCLPAPNSLESLGGENESEGEGEGESDRLAGQRQALGPEICAELAKMKLFVIGAGAIGCELLKDFAGMGIALASEGGEVSVTDNDFIERSNLNRQLLFRQSDIGKSKAACAAEACHRLNPSMRVTAHQLKLASETTGPARYAANETKRMKQKERNKKNETKE